MRLRTSHSACRRCALQYSHYRNGETLLIPAGYDGLTVLILKTVNRCRNTSATIHKSLASKPTYGHDGGIA